MSSSSHYRVHGPRHQPGSSGQDLGDRYVVEGSRGHWLVTDLSDGTTKGPRYLHHADAQHAADRLNGPRRRPTTQQGDLFDTPQEA